MSVKSWAEDRFNEVNNIEVGDYTIHPLSVGVTKRTKNGIYKPGPGAIQPEDLTLAEQFNLYGNSKLEQWGNLARSQALGAGYNDAAAAQLGMRARNRGWLSVAEQADEWVRRMAELAYAKKAQADRLDTTSSDAASLQGALNTIGRR